MTTAARYIIGHSSPKAVNFAAHASAAREPRAGAESAIVSLVAALEEYAVNHRGRYESAIGDDGVLGQYWEDIARGVLGLLNGECGRLDCGSVDSHIRNMAAAHGVTLD